MPLPPPVTEETNGAGSTNETEIRLEFTFVESLIFVFHQLARQNREFLTENADRIKDFRSRYAIVGLLTYLQNIQYAYFCWQVAIFRTGSPRLHEEVAGIIAR